MSEKTVPALRFKGFGGDWERKKLGEVATFSKGKGYSKSDLKNDGIPIILYGQMYTDYKTSINEVDTYTDEKPNSIYSLGTEVIVPASGESAEDIARASVVEQQGVLFGGDLNIIIPNSELDSIFLALSISNGNQREELSRRAQGKSVVHLRNPDLKEVNLHYPSLPEQARIGAFFRSLDALISLQSQKLGKLVTMKKAMLSKMFPKDGETVPELRFKGFSGDWERKKLGEMGDIITGSTPSTNVLAYYSTDGIPWVTPTDISENITYCTDKTLSEEGAKVARIVPENTILITSIASIGKNTMLGIRGSFNQQINGLIPNEKENYPYFLYTMSALWSEKMKISASAGTMQIVNKTEFSNLKTMTPTLPEQTAIGAFFRSLDALISLQSQKLGKLVTMKKAMLSKMFV